VPEAARSCPALDRRGPRIKRGFRRPSARSAAAAGFPCTGGGSARLRLIRARSVASSPSWGARAAGTSAPGASSTPGRAVATATGTPSTGSWGRASETRPSRRARRGGVARHRLLRPNGAARAVLVRKVSLGGKGAPDGLNQVSGTGHIRTHIVNEIECPRRHHLFFSLDGRGARPTLTRITGISRTTVKA